MELDPKYTDVVIQRWESLSGQPAYLAGDNRSFSEIAAERCTQRAVAESIEVPVGN
jgi:hypothetical protein